MLRFFDDSSAVQILVNTFASISLDLKESAVSKWMHAWAMGLTAHLWRLFAPNVSTDSFLWNLQSVRRQKIERIYLESDIEGNGWSFLYILSIRPVSSWTRTNCKIMKNKDCIHHVNSLKLCCAGMQRQGMTRTCVVQSIVSVPLLFASFGWKPWPCLFQSKYW